MINALSHEEADQWPTPRSVKGLAEEVVSLLGQRSQPHKSVRASVLDKLISLILTRGLFDAGQVASTMRAQRLSDLEMVNVYIPTVARQLGQMWCDDLLGFAEVSIGTARLQAMIHEISSRWSVEAARVGPQDITILIATLDNEDHSLGAVTLCTTLRKRGLSVDLRLGIASQTLCDSIAKSHHDVILLSCSQIEGLESLRRVIQDIRTRDGNAPVIAVGGVVLDHASDIQEQTGADLVTRDVNQVLKLAMSRRMGRIAVVA